MIIHSDKKLKKYLYGTKSRLNIRGYSHEDPFSFNTQVAQDPEKNLN